MSLSRFRPFSFSTASPRCWFVLLDAAKAAASDPPDLSHCPADLVALSLYK
ncbi:unnamed protein product, partial [Closterium sp. NIES-54]